MLDFINEHIITLRGHTNPHICKNYIEWFKTHDFEVELNQILMLTNFLKSDVEFKERIYCLRNSITQVMLCSKKDCVREVSFHNSVYQKFCSLTCRSNSEDTKIKTKSTVLKRYGVDNVSKATSIKGKISSSLKNNIDFKDIIKVNIFKRYSEEFYNRALTSNLDVTVYDHNNVGDSRELKCKKCRKTFRYGDYKTLFQSGLRCPFCFPKRFSNGSGYLSVGFKYIRTTSPNYFYWHKDTGHIVKRYGAQKHKLSKLLGELFNKELTETENMYGAGYRKFYDCGNDVYEIT